MYAHQLQTPPKSNHGKNPNIKSLLHYFSFESQLLWHGKLRMLHCLRCHIKSPFLCTLGALTLDAFLMVF
jgi:hypothetical protein